MKNKEEETVLYRKYRPKNFTEILGQESIIKTLQGAISLGNISHAYLFAGTRGIGKTSIARILAKEINCTSSDLYEIDAASNRGIDDIRELRDSVNVLPFSSPYKVYIIDEVHMLTKEAFNALLKTLEEPPKYVVFVLATTEIEKLPETIVSRCQSFNFKKPTQKILKKLVLDVAKKEDFNLESDSADLIAILGDGSFRDTLGILQKIISSSSNNKITIGEVEIITGAPRGELVNNFILSIGELNLDKGLNTIDTAVNGNIEIKIYIKLILRKLRSILLLRFANDLEKQIKKEFSEEDFGFIKKLANDNSYKISSSTLLEMLNCYELTGKSFIPQLPLELALIKIINK